MAMDRKAESSCPRTYDRMLPSSLLVAAKLHRNAAYFVPADQRTFGISDLPEVENFGHGAEQLPDINNGRIPGYYRPSMHRL